AGGADRLPRLVPALVMAPPPDEQLAGVVERGEVELVGGAAGRADRVLVGEVAAERAPRAPAVAPEDRLHVAVRADGEHVELAVVAPDHRDPRAGPKVQVRLADRAPRLDAALAALPDRAHAAVGVEGDQVPVAELAADGGDRRAGREHLTRQHGRVDRAVAADPGGVDLAGGVDRGHATLGG